MRKTKGALLTFLFLSFLVGSLIIPFVYAATTALSDGFEAANFDNWDGNGATSWQIGTTGSGSGGSANPHTGTYDAWSDSSHGGYLRSDDLDMSSATTIYISFWWQTDDTEPSDIYIYYCYGSTEVQIASIDTGNDDTWYEYTDSTSASEYLVSDFYIAFLSTCGNNENVWIDDVLIEYDAGAAHEYAYPTLTLTWASTVSTNELYNKAATLTMSWASTVDADLLAQRAASLALTWASSVSTNELYNKAATLALSFASSAAVQFGVLRTASLTLTWGSSVSTLLDAVRSASLTLSWASSVDTLLDVTRAASLSLSWGSTVSRWLSFERAASLAITWGSSVSRAWTAFRSAALDLTIGFTNDVGLIISRSASLVLSFLLSGNASADITEAAQELPSSEMAGWLVIGAIFIILPVAIVLFIGRKH